MKLKNVWFRLCSIGLACLMAVSLWVPVSALANTDSSTDGTSEDNTSSDVVTKDKVHAAYTFDLSSDLTAEVGGVYPLSTEEFGASLLQNAEGYHGGGAKGYFNLNAALFSAKSQFTVGFWTRVSLNEAENRSTIFLWSGSENEFVELRYAVEKGVLVLKLEASDGANQASCSYDLSQVLTEELSWVHYAFTYKKSGTASLLTLYVNGKTVGTSIAAKYLDFSETVCKNAAFHNVVLDDLYVTDTALDATTVASMRNHSVKDIYQDEGNLSGSQNPDNPSGGTTDPVDKHNYTWAAYLFEGTFAAGTDFHSGDIPATVDRNGSLIDSAKLKEKYGYALIRRENTAPEAYLTLDSRLFRGQSAFTFAAWVYRNGTSVDNQEYLLELKGEGTLRFAPYAGEGGKLSGYVEYTDLRGNLQRKTLASANQSSPKNNWVHYALTVSAAGELTVYVNGVVVGVFSTGITPASADYTQCRAVAGSSASDSTRTAVDELYVTPKVLSDAEIRKIHFYGLSRYTSEVLPDPGNTGNGDVVTNPFAPDAVDRAEDAYTKTGSIAGGFIGTTFDGRDNQGKDWNNSVQATITGGRLSQGISSYGLALDGASFIRYPARILDGVNELTISLSYSWEGPGADNKSQRIFDFSRKTSSVAEPAAYIFLETGNGFSGLRFGISDGVSSTYLPCDYNEVNTWTRVTVTIKDGKITLYVNDTVAATGDTTVDLASICPNFCYVGRSGVKGDPMFVGSVDEVYISDKALTSEEVAPFVQGISYAINGEKAKALDLWSLILVVIIVVGILLVLGVVALIVVIIVKKDKKSPEEEAPVPVPVSSMEGPEVTVIGPRTAARIASSAPDLNGDSTVKFRKVDSSDRFSNDTELTTKFRRISDDKED